MKRYSPFPIGALSLVSNRLEAIIKVGTQCYRSILFCCENWEGILEEVMPKCSVHSLGIRTGGPSGHKLGADFIDS